MTTHLITTSYTGQTKPQARWHVRQLHTCVGLTDAKNKQGPFAFLFGHMQNYWATWPQHINKKTASRPTRPTLPRPPRFAPTRLKFPPPLRAWKSWLSRGSGHRSSARGWPTTQTPTAFAASGPAVETGGGRWAAKAWGWRCPRQV